MHSQFFTGLSEYGIQKTRCRLLPSYPVMLVLGTCGFVQENPALRDQFFFDDVVDHLSCSGKSGYVGSMF